MKKESPSMDAWMKEAKLHESAPKIGMYLTHQGVVRQTAKAMVRENETNTKPVVGMMFSYDASKVSSVVEATLQMEGIYYLKVWLNEGFLRTGDDIMFILIGGDIRPHVTAALDYLISQIKNNCVTETEVFDPVVLK